MGHLCCFITQRREDEQPEEPAQDWVPTFRPDWTALCDTLTAKQGHYLLSCLQATTGITTSMST